MSPTSDCITIRSNLSDELLDPSINIDILSGSEALQINVKLLPSNTSLDDGTNSIETFSSKKKDEILITAEIFYFNYKLIY